MEFHTKHAKQIDHQKEAEAAAAAAKQQIKQQTLLLWHQQGVAELFDGYAETFDEDLVDGLRYDIPNLIFRQLGENQHFARALDLGCGTGLGGAAFRDACDYMEGSDLSSGMLRKAKARGVYDTTKHMDLVRHLRVSKSASFDLILSADVIMYVFDLTIFVKEAKRVLSPNGILAFSTESLEEEAGVDMLERESARYAHARQYVLSLAQEVGGLQLQSVKNVLGRMDEGKEIRSDIFVFAREAST